jgi:photosystem II stability/assembly factor-like uncharacterized protein
MILQDISKTPVVAASAAIRTTKVVTTVFLRQVLMSSNLKWQLGIHGMLIGIFLLGGCSTSSQTLATSMPASWSVIGVYNADHSIMTAGFLDETHVATGGVGGQMGYSGDAAQTWQVNNSVADCRYGMDIISPEVIWSCGGATHVRRSMDGGKTWQVLTNFGDPHSIRGACHSASFLDENVGWLSNSHIFGTTVDGGSSWQMQAIPATANKIATIDTYKSGEGYLLDQKGVLFFTDDNGKQWRETSRLDLGEIVLPPTAYQLAAMRFSDADHGMIVVSSSPYGKPTPVIAFHTSDGGVTWTSETVPVLAGPVYLAREDGYLTVITANGQITLLQYKE